MLESDFPTDPLDDPGRLAALERSGLLDSPDDAAFDRLTRLACRLLGTPVAIVSVVTADRQFFKSQQGLPEPWAARRGTPLSHSFCQYVVRSGRPLVVEDARREPLVRANPAIDDLDVIGYAGVPLTVDGEHLGAFCVIASEPRAWSQEDLTSLAELAELAMTELRLRQAVGALDQRAHVLNRTARALEEAQALAQMGSWEWEPATGRHAWSRELCRMLGVPHGPRDRQEYEAMVPAAIRTDLERRLLESRAGDGRWHAEYPLTLPDGRTRMLVSRGQAVPGPGGELEIVRGTVQDVTIQLEQEARFRAAFAQAPVGAAMLGLHPPAAGQWLEVNQELEGLLGAARGTLRGTEIDAHVHPEDLPRSRLELGRLAAGEVERTQHEERLRAAGGDWIWTVCTRSLVRLPAGEPGYAISHHLDISERKRHETELEHLAHHDPLTGLPNRRRFAEELERALAHAARYGRHGALLLLDLDRFKAVNDQAGHGAGDEVLVRVTAALRAGLRGTDTLARIGGDEFAVLLPEATPGQARVVAEKVLRAVKEHGQVRDLAEPLGVTASIGISCWSSTARLELAEAVAGADTAMYEAKAGGGNDYCVFNEAGSLRRLPTA